jgi:uncharacterized membrane protein (UPF0182 family)
MWGRYHVSDPDEFYEGSDDWVVPQAVGSTRRAGSATTEVGPDGQEIDARDRYPAQYLLMQLPGETEESFVLLRPYVTASDDDEEVGQNQMRSFITASSDPDSYGRLRTYRMAEGELPDGPNLAAEEIQSRSEVGEQVRQLCTERTVCTFTSPSIVPVADALMYVQTLVVAGSDQGTPRIQRVIVNYLRPDDPQIAIATTLRGALVELFGADVPESIEDVAAVDPVDPDDPEAESPEPEGTITEQEGDLIDQLVAAFDDADAAAREGDLVGQAEALERASEIAAELQALRESAEGEGSSTTTTTTLSDGETTTTTAPETTTTTSAGA